MPWAWNERYHPWSTTLAGGLHLIPMLLLMYLHFVFSAPARLSRESASRHIKQLLVAIQLLKTTIWSSLSVRLDSQLWFLLWRPAITLLYCGGNTRQHYPESPQLPPQHYDSKHCLDIFLGPLYRDCVCDWVILPWLFMLPSLLIEWKYCILQYILFLWWCYTIIASSKIMISKWIPND